MICLELSVWYPPGWQQKYLFRGTPTEFLLPFLNLSDYPKKEKRQKTVTIFMSFPISKVFFLPQRFRIGYFCEGNRQKHRYTLMSFYIHKGCPQLFSKIVFQSRTYCVAAFLPFSPEKIKTINIGLEANFFFNKYHFLGWPRYCHSSLAHFLDMKQIRTSRILRILKSSK